MRLTAVREIGPVTIRFRLPGGQHTEVRVRPGASQRVNVAVCGSGDWYATFRSDVHAMNALRFVSVQATAPVFTPSRSACPAPEPVAA
jgi:hypothetical protein